MKRIFLYVALFALAAVCAMIWGIQSLAAQAPTPVAERWNETGPQPTPASPFAALGRFSRADRKMAREVMRDAADAMGESRREFMRGVMTEKAADYKGSTPHLDELETSLALHDDAPGFDIDEFARILDMIIEFIKKLMAIFGMFALDTAPALDASVVAFAPVDVPAVAAVPFLSTAA